MGRRASKIILSVQERNELECLLRTHSTSQQLARRVQIILLAADGLSVSRNCKSVGCLAQDGEQVEKSYPPRQLLFCRGP
jgi:hypothetical protein